MPDITVFGPGARMVSYLGEIGGAIIREEKARTFAAANVVRTEILKLLSGSRSGRTYRVPGTKRTYTASAPGEPPGGMHADLRRSVKAMSEQGPDSTGALVGVTDKKGPWLEFGTGRAGAAKPQTDLPEGYVHGPSAGMAPRPYLRPALENTRAKVRQILSSRMWFR